MFRIVRTSTLTALTENAIRLVAEGKRYRREAEDARRDAETVRRKAQDAETRLAAATEDAGRRLGSLIRAARDPVTGPGIQAQIALQVVRDIIAEAKASGDEDAIEGVRMMDALLGEDWSAAEPAAAGSRT